MHKYFLNNSENYLHLLLMPLYTCFGIKNEPVNPCVLWKMYKCYLILLLDVMLINVKSQINSILNRWIWNNELSIEGWLLNLNYFLDSCVLYFSEILSKIWIRDVMIKLFSNYLKINYMIFVSAHTGRNIPQVTCYLTW